MAWWSDFTLKANILIIGLLVNLTIGCLLLVIEPHTFPVNTVRIKGQFINTDLLTLQDTISHMTVNGLLWCDLSKLHLALLALPWVKTVQVQKQWPDTILIQAQEYHPIAKWQNKFIDIEGNIVSIGHIKSNWDLPNFMIPKEYLSKTIDYYIKFVPMIKAAKLNIHELGYDTFRAWYILLDNGMKLWLGHTDIETRLTRFFKIYPYKSIGSNSNVDLRYNNGIAIY